MEAQSTVTVSQQLIRLRRRMARRWHRCRAVGDPELIAISQELDRVLYRLVTDPLADPYCEGAVTNGSRND